MSKTLLIDANSVFHAAQNATRLTSGGIETQAAFGTIKTARELKKLYPQFEQVWCHDKRAEWRYALYPGYKAGRSGTAEQDAARKSLNMQRPYIGRSLSTLGQRQVTAIGYEADDLIAWMSASLSKNPDNTVGVISGDKDLLQFIRPNVFWRDMRDDTRIVNHKNFYDYTGCKSTMEFLERKCLTGDTSDTITGVGGIGEKGALEFIAEFGSVREFWRRCEAGEFNPETPAHRRLWKGESPYSKDEWAKQLDLSSVAADEKVKKKMLKAHMDNWQGQGRLLFRRNFQLMQLLKVAPPKKEDLMVDIGKHDKESFAKVCEEMSFVSILRNIDEFTNLFGSQK